MFLLDTDAISEIEKPRPNPGFLAWIASVDFHDLHLSAITVAELWEGIVRLPRSQKRRALEAMFEMLPERFYGRIIPVDSAIAVTYGELQARHGPLPVLDSLIASTALTRRLTLVTHNTRDMARSGAVLLDPWTD